MHTHIHFRRGAERGRGRGRQEEDEAAQDSGAAPVGGEGLTGRGPRLFFCKHFLGFDATPRRPSALASCASDRTFGELQKFYEAEDNMFKIEALEKEEKEMTENYEDSETKMNQTYK